MTSEIVRKTKFVADISAGDHIENPFVIIDKALSHKKDGNPYLTVTLGDKSGRIKGVMWENVDQFSGVADAGDFIMVSGTVSEYRGMLQMVIKSLSHLSAGNIDPADFLPATSRDVDQMFERLKAVTDSIASEHIRALLNAFWTDAPFVENFKRAPAAKMMHHAYLGGLLEHTLSMVLLAEKVAGHYSGLNRDLLLAGAILHDIGKVRELRYDSSIDYTDEGRLLSHIVIGLDLVESKIRSLDDFPEADTAMIKHMIVSHHGAREFGSPEPPKTIEAVLLNYVDEIDSRVNSIRQFMTDDNPGSNWTGYHRLLERHFYKG